MCLQTDENINYSGKLAGNYIKHKWCVGSFSCHLCWFSWFVLETIEHHYTALCEKPSDWLSWDCDHFWWEVRLWADMQVFACTVQLRALTTRAFLWRAGSFWLGFVKSDALKTSKGTDVLKCTWVKGKIVNIGNVLATARIPENNEVYDAPKMLEVSSKRFFLVTKQRVRTQYIRFLTFIPKAIQRAILVPLKAFSGKSTADQGYCDLTDLKTRCSLSARLQPQSQ